MPETRWFRGRIIDKTHRRSILTFWRETFVFIMYFPELEPSIFTVPCIPVVYYNNSVGDEFEVQFKRTSDDRWKLVLERT